MKRLLDRLMYRLGYVTRERYFRAAAPKIARALDEWTVIYGEEERYSGVVVTTDYRKDIPCS